MNRTNGNRPGFWSRCENCFHQQHGILWPALSRTANLLIILNVSLFFLTGAVTREGYRFPVYSLILLALATLLILLPLGLHHRLWFYLSVLSLYVFSSWLLGASIVYWFEHPVPLEAEEGMRTDGQTVRICEEPLLVSCLLFSEPVVPGRERQIP